MAKIKINFTNRVQNNSQRGFALISTIIVMSMLLLLAIAMLSLSSVETRGGGESKNQLIAEANARLALNLAIAELQLSLGDDRRITAPASQLVSAKHPSLIAVYDARTMAEELENTLASNYYERDVNFRRWLVSHPDQDQIKSYRFSEDGTFPHPIKLRSNEFDPTMDLVASKIDIVNGKYAWAIEDDSLKARIDLLPQIKTKNPATIASKTMHSGLPTANGYKIDPNFTKLDVDDPNLKKLYSDQVFELLPDNTKSLDELRLSVSTQAVSLLTDVKHGGFKRDLSLLLELPETELPSEYKDIKTHTTRWNGRGDLNYKKFSDIHTSSGSTQYDTLPVSLIQGYYQFYKLGMNPDPHANDGSRAALVNKRPEMTTLINTSNGPNDNVWKGYGHTFRLVPVVSRIRDVVWVKSKETAANSGKYNLEFLSFPVVTFWNPYNIKIKVPQGHMQYVAQSSVAEVKVGAKEHRIELGRRTAILFGALAGQPEIELQPGETKIFFPSFPNSTSTSMRMTDQWPANINDISRFAFRAHNTQASGAEPVEISLRARDNNLVAGLTHYNDGWLATHFGNFRNHKFHNWAFSLNKDNNQAWKIYDSGEKCLTSTSSALAQRARPVAIIDLAIKSANDAKYPSTVWNFDFPQKMSNHLLYPSVPATSGTPSLSQLRGMSQAAQLSLEYIPLRGDSDFAKHLSTNEDNQGVHDYMGYQHDPAFGSSYLTMCELPFVPLRSLGQLQHLPLQDEEWRHDYPTPVSPTWSFGIGNSSAHPWLETNTLTKDRSLKIIDHWTKGYDRTYAMIDRLSVANAMLFDSYFFSTVTPQNSPWFAQYGDTRTMKQVLSDALEGETALPSDRYRFNRGLTLEDLEPELLDGDNKPKVDAYKKIASYLTVHGGFNINSTSVDAWKLVLASTFQGDIVKHPVDPNEAVGAEKAKSYLISRYSHPNGSSIENGGDPFADGFNGYRELTETQITELATAIVAEVKERGPFRSLGEFVNRRRTDTASDPATLRGAIANALLSPDVTINALYGNKTFTSADFPDADFITPEAVTSHRATGLPGFVNQADILTPLAPIITCRGDTFTIRAYGEATGPNNEILATAYCEAVVQRVPQFVDSADKPETDLASLTSAANTKYGRKFIIKSFRWVNAKEIK